MEKVDVLFFNWEAAGDHNDESTNTTIVNSLQSFNLPWLNNACVDKIDEGNTIIIYEGDNAYTNKNHATFKLNEDKTKAILSLDGKTPTKEFTVKEVNGKLGVYIKGDPIKIEFGMPADHAMNMSVTIINSNGIPKKTILDADTKPLSEQKSWKALESFLKSQGVKYDKEELDDIKSTMNRARSSTTTLFHEKEDARKKRAEDFHKKQEAKPHAEEAQKCPKCGSVCDSIKIDGQVSYQCPKCKEEPQKPQIKREDNYDPYTFTKKDKDGNIEPIPLCNFNVYFNRILKVGDVRVINGTFKYIDSKTSGKKNKLFEAEENTFHRRNEFELFFGKYSELMWYERRHLDDLLTEINKDKTTQTPVIIEKIEDFGWNSKFTAYHTPTCDIRLRYAQAGEFEVPLQSDSDPSRFVAEVDTGDVEDDEGNKVPEGSVKILNQKISDAIKLGLRPNSSKIHEHLLHVKEKLLILSPEMHRLIPLVTIAPLSSLIHSMGKSYQEYLSGETGWGKSQQAFLLMKFFSTIGSDEDLVNILRDKPNAIEEWGYYHRDCLFVVDNFKESAIDKKELPGKVALLQGIADRQGTRRMSKSGIESYRVRGTVLVTGEEKVSDASTIRKYDNIKLKNPVESAGKDTLLDQCKAYSDNYSSITVEYIRWLLETYGENIRENIKERTLRYPFKETVLTLNAVGYELFIDFMRWHNIITDEERAEWLRIHIEKLKVAEAEKVEEVREKLTSEVFKNALTNMLMDGVAELKGDPEYNKTGENEIGKTVKGGTEIVFYPERYPAVRGYASYKLKVDLPSDFDSILEKLKKEIGSVGEHSTRTPDKGSPAYLPTFLRESILPHSNFGNNGLHITALADLIAGMIEYDLSDLRITEMLDAKTYDQILLYVTGKSIPESGKKDVRNKYTYDTVEPLLKAYFKGKYGATWVVPTK